MSVEEELRSEIAALKGRVAELQRRADFNGRLGPRPETQADIDRRTERLVEAVKQAKHEHEIDADGRQICTTKGDAPSKARAEQTEKTGQHKSYIVLCEEERQKGFTRPYRDAYKHLTCGGVTRMGRSLSETYARDPSFYGATFCVQCNAHYPVVEFVWTADDQQVGS